MTPPEFRIIAEKIRPFTDYIYLHIMGEPLLHPDLGEILDIAGELDLRVIITTNGTLLGGREGMLSDTAVTLLSSESLYRVNISLHAETGGGDYLENAVNFAEKAAERRVYCSLRLWNLGDKAGEDLLLRLNNRLETPGAGRNYIFIHREERFRWPDLAAPESDKPQFCLGLREQLGILADGTVVPCCLDHEGDLALGNLFRGDLEEILNSERAAAIYKGFSERRAVEALCRRCGYSQKRFG